MTTIREAAGQLRRTCLATTLTINKWKVSKPFNNSQKEQAAEPFAARAVRLAASKKIVNLKHPRYQAVTKLCNKIRQYWQSVTLPYVESDKRLLKRETEHAFDAMIVTYRMELLEAAEGLQEVRQEIIREARETLGDLFDMADYPSDLAACYSLVVDKPMIEPPSYLQEVNPQEYERQLEQFQLAMQQSVILAEQALATEMAKMVHGLAEHLGTDEQGRPRRFRSSSIHQLREFFERFKELKIRDGVELDGIVQQAQELLNGHTPNDIRTLGEVRAEVQAGMQRITEQLVPLIAPKARRRLGVKVNVEELVEA